MFIGVLTLSMAPFMSSCSEDDTSDEWTANNVYLQRNNYLAPAKTFLLLHSPLGVSGDKVETTFTLRTQKPATKDMNISLKAECKDVPSEAIVLTSKQVVIKAGESVSEEITASIPDWSFAQNDIDEKTYELKISIDAVQAIAGNIHTSELQKTLVTEIKKSGRSNIGTVKPDNWKGVERGGWTVNASHVYDRGFEAESAIDGNQSTTWFAYGTANNRGECWWSVTLDESITLVGFSLTRQSSGFGDRYNVQKVTIDIKKEGDTEWTTYNTNFNLNSFNGDAPQYAFLSAAITNVKEFRIHCLVPTDFTGFAELNLYESK